MSTFVDEAKEFLQHAGYDKHNLVGDCAFTVHTDEGLLESQSVDLVAFSQTPHDLQNACIAAFDSREDIAATLAQLRYLTAPLALVGDSEKVELWSIRQSVPDEPFDLFDRSSWRDRLYTRLTDFSPRTISEAKNDRIQLEFVDAGLSPWTKRVTSTSLKSLLEELVRTGINGLTQKNRSKDSALNDVMRVVFNLFTCRALQDKGVIPQRDDPFESVFLAHKHFSENINLEVLKSSIIPKKLVVKMFEHLRTRFSFSTLSAGILSDSYENALVTEKGRRALGIYYTPRSLTDYILKRLPVEMILQDKRVVWDPCCGCGSFLLAGLSRLSDLLPQEMSSQAKHQYLRKRIIGSDKDAFAREFASLALVLSDLHNKNGWKLIPIDATKVTRKDLPAPPTILTTNLPFKELKEGIGVRKELSAEILLRLIDICGPGALLGVILPQSFLDSSAARNARRKILNECEILEIDLLPGAFFGSATETAVLMMRKRLNEGRSSIATVRELRSSEYQRFVKDRSFTRTYPVDPLRWECDEELRFHVSPLADLWRILEGRLSCLDDVAEVKNGLQIKTSDKTSVSEKQRGNDEEYIDRLDVLRPFALLTESGIQQNKWIKYGAHLHRARSREIFKKTKVLINSNRNPGSAWRIVAAISRTPLYFSDNFHAVIPRDVTTVEQLVAVLNSPVANAWFDSRCKRRKVVQRILKTLPFPVFDKRLGQELDVMVRRMEKAVLEKWREQAEGMFYDGMVETVDTSELRAEIDQLVYHAYGLSRHDRKQIDKLMQTDKRPS